MKSPSLFFSRIPFSMNESKRFFASFLPYLLISADMISCLSASIPDKHQEWILLDTGVGLHKIHRCVAHSTEYA